MHLQIPTESTLWLAAPSHDVLADALSKQSLNRGISVMMKQQLPRPCVQTVAHGVNGIADISCVHAVCCRSNVSPWADRFASVAKMENTTQKWAHLRQTPLHAQQLCCLRRHVWLWQVNDMNDDRYLLLAGLLHGRERVLLGILLLSFLNMCCSSSTMFTQSRTQNHPLIGGICCGCMVGF